MIGDLAPKKEGMKIPKDMVKKYGFGVGVWYPYDEFVESHIKEFGEHPYENRQE